MDLNKIKDNKVVVKITEEVKKEGILFIEKCINIIGENLTKVSLKDKIKE
jgi:hypothetical protein